MKKSIFSVSQVNAYIKKLFVNDYVINDIWIKGEVSNCKNHSSGHVYFTLKDNNSAISCVVFKTYKDYIQCELKDGMNIAVRGYISIYERTGQYQLYVQQAISDGVGILYQRFEKLKAKLENEGYFLDTYKKNIPRYPKKVGIVTSDTGAAIKDVINVSSRRNPYIQLMLYPSLVQGEGAAENIVKGIQYLDKIEEVEVIIIGRGGGSIEDLWAFNEEIVAKAVYAATTPIISAVGHETDFTIADFVADLRASTPSAAAELAIPAYNEVIELLNKHQYKLENIINYKIESLKKSLELNKVKLKFNSPATKVEQEYQYVMDLEDRIKQRIYDVITTNKNKIELLTEKLKVLSPVTNLEKGYTYITDSSGQQIISIDSMDIGKNLFIQMHDGLIEATVGNIKKGKWGTNG